MPSLGACRHFRSPPHRPLANPQRRRASRSRIGPAGLRGGPGASPAGSRCKRGSSGDGLMAGPRHPGTWSGTGRARRCRSWRGACVPALQRAAHSGAATPGEGRPRSMRACLLPRRPAHARRRRSAADSSAMRCRGSCRDGRCSRRRGASLGSLAGGLSIMCTVQESAGQSRPPKAQSPMNAQVPYCTSFMPSGEPSRP